MSRPVKEQGATRSVKAPSGDTTFSDLLKKPYTPGGYDKPGSDFGRLLDKPYKPGGQPAPPPPWRNPAVRVPVRIAGRIALRNTPAGRVLQAADALDWWFAKDPNAPTGGLKTWDKTGWVSTRHCGGVADYGPIATNSWGCQNGLTSPPAGTGTGNASYVATYQEYTNVLGKRWRTTELWERVGGGSGPPPTFYYPPTTRPYLVDQFASDRDPTWRRWQPTDQTPDNRPDDDAEDSTWPDPQAQGDPVPGDGTVPDGREGLLSNPGPDTKTQFQPLMPPPRRPPETGERERKVMSRSKSLGIALFRALDNISENAEIVDAFFEALPKRVQDKWDCNRKNFGIDAGGQYGIDNADCKARALWHNWRKVDIETAFENLIKNYLEDKFLGYIHKNLPPQQGAAFEDSFKGLNKELQDWLDEYIDVSGWIEQ